MTTCAPNVYPAPRGERENSSRSGSGSDQTRSAMGPSCGISRNRSITFIWSMEWIDGERPARVRRGFFWWRGEREGFTAVDAEDVVVDDDTEGEEVEHVCEVVPHTRIPVFATTLRVEPVALRHAPAFVVPADQVHSRGVSQFQADEEGDGLNGEETAVDVVA